MSHSRGGAVTEDERIMRKREVFEKRRQNLLNARKRTIGVDVEALDAQVAEMRANRADDKEADRFESKLYISSPIINNI